MQNLSLTLALAAINAIKNIGPISGWEVVDILPATGEPNKLYFVPKPDGIAPDAHDEYVWIASKSSWEKVGSTDVDMTSKADKVSGAIVGDVATLDSTGNLVDSGVAISSGLTVPSLRQIYAGTAAMSEGDTLAAGVIYLQYSAE